MTNTDLIMELTMEQGPGRITQVQPPRGAWERYFEIDFGHLPVLRLTNRQREGARPKARPVVGHHHVWTVEIEEATVERPAIIRFHRTGENRFSYWIYQQNDHEYSHCIWLLTNFRNPFHKPGRRWLVI